MNNAPPIRISLDSFLACDDVLDRRERAILRLLALRCLIRSYWRSVCRRRDVFCFALRAGHLSDLQRFVRVVPRRDVADMLVKAVTIGDSEVSGFIWLRGWSLQDVRAALRIVPDGVQMLDTVTPADEYAGDEWYAAE
jgi:hypothetical protein